MTGFGYTALALTFACVVLYAFWSSGSSGVMPRLLRSKVLTSFGKYSYAMYVFHVPLSWHVKPLIGFLATCWLAVLSWVCCERQFLKLRRRFTYRFERDRAA